MANLKDTFVLGKLTVTDSIIADKFKGPLEGNAATATKFNTSRTFSFAGDVSGTVTTDCASGFEVKLSVANNSHNHTYTNITDLDTPLTNYLNQAKKYTNDQIAALVDASPDLLNTLNELAAAINDDPNFATTVANNIATKVAKTGDTMSGTLHAHGGITLNSSTAEANTPPYILGIKGFAEGGNVTWSARGNVSVGHADAATSATTAGATFTNSINGDTHALALKNYFDNNKSTAPRNKLLSFYSSAYGNGSQCMGYFLNGYDSNPYGGFFVAHYNTPKYVGIQNGAYTEWELSKVGHNHNDLYLQLTGGTMSGGLTVNGKATFIGGVNIRGNTADKPLIVRGITGSDGSGNIDALYLQYGANKPVYFGNTGTHTISADGANYSGNSATATILKTARNFTIGNTARSFNGSAAVTWTPNDIGYRYEWNASVRGVTWSRLCNMGAAVGVEGSKYILNISATRGNVVYNDTFLITAHHASNGKIIKIAGNNYTSGHQIRLLVNSNGDSYVELYDNAQSITTATYQTVRCRIIPIFAGTPTMYTSFTNGTTLPSGYSVKQTMTINTTDMQGNLSGNADTASKWATARTVSINSSAGTTGTSVNGSQNVSLTIPSTMTGFSSITSTNFVGNVNGTLDGIDSSGFLRNYISHTELTTTETVDTPSYLYTVSQSGSIVETTTRPTGQTNNAWGILHVHTHQGNYSTQIGFATEANKLFFRNAHNTTTFGGWETILASNNYTDYTVTKAGGGAYGTWGISITGSSGSAGSATTANSLSVQDTRSEDTQPKNMRSGLSIQLKATGTGGLSDGGSYYSNLSLKQWGDYSGGPFSQLAITANQNLWFRTSSSETTWNSWKKVAIQSANNTFSKVYITSNTDMNGTAQPGLMIGPSTGAHIEIDNNEIQCFKTKDGAGAYTTDTLYFQQLGGAANFGTASAACRITASSFSARSDRRLKENLIIFNPQKSILDLPIYKYDFINGEKEQIGCMAQDLQEICPELINVDEKGYLSIKESKIVYLLINEIKKLKNEVEVLKYGN